MQGPTELFHPTSATQTSLIDVIGRSRAFKAAPLHAQSPSLTHLANHHNRSAFRSANRLPSKNSAS